MISQRQTVPIIPLHTVLFPDGPLPLRIFEPRYLDMISKCLKDGTDFGICLISDGDEVGAVASAHEVGTLADIRDWHMEKDGILGVTVSGKNRFQVRSSKILSNQLMMAEIELFNDEEVHPSIPQEFQTLVGFLKDHLDKVPEQYRDLPCRYDDANWVGFRLAEILPLKLSQKQYFLQLDDPLVRIERLSAVMDHLDIDD